jgi:hypothetical protein
MRQIYATLANPTQMLRAFRMRSAQQGMCTIDPSSIRMQRRCEDIFVASITTFKILASLTMGE